MESRKPDDSLGDNRRIARRVMTWDDDCMLWVDLTGKYPMLWIPAELEKGNQDRLLPIAPEFAEFLLATPESERTGFVFNPLPRHSADHRLCADRVGRLVSLMGKAAGVKVNTNGKLKYATLTTCDGHSANAGRRG